MKTKIPLFVLVFPALELVSTHFEKSSINALNIFREVMSLSITILSETLVHVKIRCIRQQIVISYGMMGILSDGMKINPIFKLRILPMKKWHAEWLSIDILIAYQYRPFYEGFRAASRRCQCWLCSWCYLMMNVNEFAVFIQIQGL